MCISLMEIIPYSRTYSDCHNDKGIIFINISIVQRSRFGACMHMVTTSYIYMYMLEL